MSRPSAADIVAAAEGAVQAAGEHLLKAARNNAPVDTGELRESGSVRVSGTTATVSFNAGHALIVHENMRLKHETGRAKYLESAMAEEREQIKGIIVAHIGRVWGG